MNHLFKFGTYGHSLEVRREMYKSVYKTLSVRVPMDVDDNRLVARENIRLTLMGIDRAITEQYDLHPEDRK